jgi:hypothetical protein
MIVGDFSTPLLPTDRIFREKNQQNSSELNDAIYQMHLTGICKVFHPTATQHTFFSTVHETFSKIDHILGHKTSLNKYKIIEITTCRL